jgi:GT2 family glycosyltransferase
VGQVLRSLLEDPHEYEIVVVDNASTDGSALFVDQAFPGVRLIQSPRNLGFGQGNNLGAQWARGAYLAFLNPDAVVEPGWLEALIGALESEPQAGLATSKILLMDDPARINACGMEVHCTGVTLCRGLGSARDAFSEMEEVGAVSGAAFVARREVYESLGGFDSTFFLYMEDTDLSWRARLAGYRCVYVPDSIVYHDYRLRFNAAKTFYQERNRYLMLLKGLRWRTLVVMAPILLLGEVVTWGFVLLRERRNLGNKLRAYAWILKHWREIVQERQHVQATRKVQDHDLLAQCTHRLDYGQTGTGLWDRLAHLMLDPLFLLLHRLTLALIRW